MRRDVVSVSRKSECHEMKRCSCRFGCSSVGGGGDDDDDDGDGGGGSVASAAGVGAPSGGDG